MKHPGRWFFGEHKNNENRPELMKTIKSASLTGRSPRTTVPLQGQAAEPEAHNNEDRSFESLDTVKTKSPEVYGSHGLF